MASVDQLMFGAADSCDGTPGRKTCEGDFPFLYEYKVAKLMILYYKGANWIE